MTRRAATGYRKVCIGIERRRRNFDLAAPKVSEDRPVDVSPLPPGSIEDAFAEMYANDPETQEWVRSERLAILFGRGR